MLRFGQFRLVDRSQHTAGSLRSWESIALLLQCSYRHVIELYIESRLEETCTCPLETVSGGGGVAAPNAAAVIDVAITASRLVPA